VITESEAKSLASKYLQESQKPDEPDLGIDWGRVRIKEGILIAPYNSTRFLETRNPYDQLLDCWPILVNLRTGEVRFGEIEERDFWRKP
jgi:hypothetical protein